MGEKLVIASGDQIFYGALFIFCIQDCFPLEFQQFSVALCQLHIAGICGKFPVDLTEGFGIFLGLSHIDFIAHRMESLGGKPLGTVGAVWIVQVTVFAHKLQEEIRLLRKFSHGLLHSVKHIPLQLF